MRFQVRCMRKRGHRMDLKQIENLPALTGEAAREFVSAVGVWKPWCYHRYTPQHALDASPRTA